MGGHLSRLFHSKGTADLDSDPSTAPAVPLVDSLNDIAAYHWLTLEQLHNLYIIAPRTTFSFPCCSPKADADNAIAAVSPSGSPPLSPCSPASSQCEPRRHCPDCCSRFTSKAPASVLTVAPSPQQPFRLLSLEPNLPPASPADVIAAPSGFGSCSYRASADRDALYRTSVRPSIETLLLDTTPLDKDDLSIVLDYLIDPPQLTPPHIAALALLSPQLLTDTKPAAQQQAAQSAAYSDLLLTSSGCFTHRKGQIDRTLSLRAKQLRLNFATIQTGLYRVVADGVLRMSVYGLSEFYFDQHLHDEKRKRLVSLTVEPFDERRAEECRQRYEVCMANQLLLVWGQGV